jgi:RNA polymerase sigma factor (sigma-70 family)
MRAPVYGELQIHKANNLVRGLWYSRHEEPKPVEFYSLCDREWQDPANHERTLDRQWLVGTLLSKLDDRRRDVLVMHYVEEMTLEEIGDVYGVTKERVRQIERDAIRRVKYWARDAIRLNQAIKEHRDQLKEKLQ